MKVCALDLGFSTAYAILGSGKRPLSGSFRLKGSSEQMGEAFRSLVVVVRGVIAEHQPDVIAVAMPFIGKHIPPVSLIPIMAFPCRVQEIADEAGIAFRRISEPDARRAFLGAGLTPRKSKDIKRAVMEACALRGWNPCDNHAADAMCVADLVLNQAEPGQAHKSTPLFISAGLARARARRAKAAA